MNNEIIFDRSCSKFVMSESNIKPNPWKDKNK